MNLEKIQQLIQKEDSKGNYIQLERPSLSVLLRDNGNKERRIGNIIEREGSVIYHKHESEAEIHRKSKSWSINRNVLDAVDMVEYETDRAVYTIEARKARSVGLSFKWDNKSFVDRKCFVPIKHWDIVWKDSNTGPIINLFGYEWYSEIATIVYQDYVTALTKTLASEYRTHTMYPAKEDIFLPYRLTSFMDTKVIIVAPYVFPTKGSNGLAFGFEGEGSVPQATKELLKEIEWDIYQGCLMLSSDASMRTYADQGVLLLNYLATSNEQFPHMNIGWEKFTADIVSALSEKREHLVFMFYGFATELSQYVDNSKHYVINNGALYTPDYVRDKYFTKCNNFLISRKLTPISW